LRSRTRRVTVARLKHLRARAATMLMACKSHNCRPCGAADQTSDTVKVDMASIHGAGKENSRPQHKSEEQLKLERQQAAEERDREQAAARAEMERNRQEQLRLQKLQEEQRRAAEAAEQKRKQMQLQAEAEERERQRAAEVAEMQRRQMEEAKREREARERAEEEARRARKEREDAEKVAAFLRAKGFSGVTTGRRKMLKTSYPLHAAVADKDAEMVALLLQAGADPAQKNSSGATPEQQALKLNKNGSHEAVLARFRVSE